MQIFVPMHALNNTFRTQLATFKMLIAECVGETGEYRRRGYCRWKPQTHPWSHLDHHSPFPNPRN